MERTPVTGNVHADDFVGLMISFAFSEFSRGTYYFLIIDHNHATSTSRSI